MAHRVPLLRSRGSTFGKVRKPVLPGASSVKCFYREYEPVNVGQQDHQRLGVRDEQVHVVNHLLKTVAVVSENGIARRASAEELAHKNWDGSIYQRGQISGIRA